MALQIWLPMIKDLRNQGLVDVTVTNNGATFDTNGKLGGCYSFGTGNSYIVIDSTPLKTFTEFSFACWVKIISWNTNYSTIFAAKNSTAVSWNNLIFSLLRDSSTSALCFNISNGSSYTATSCRTETLSLNTWYHIACTYKNGQIKLYQDGNVVSIYNTNVIPNFNSIVNLWIGKSNENSYQSNNLLNDIRIYDHTLSPLEVKHIAQGLILHYPLSNKYLENTTNLVTGITAGGQTTVNNNIVTTSGVDKDTYFQINLSENIVVGTQYTFSCDAEIPSGTWRFPLGNQNNTTLDFVLHNGHNVYSFVANDTDWGTKRLFMDDMNGATNSARSTGLKTKMYNFQLEKKDHETGFAGYGVSRTNTIVYDTSGYGNNGTIVGNLSVDNNTPRYNVSTSFNGVDNCIQLENISSLLQDVFTINLWFKKDSLGSKAYETLFGGPSGFEMDTRSGSSQTLSLYMASTRGGNVYSSFNFGEWYMVTLVNDGTNELYYVNGELVKTITKKSMPSGNYFIGAWQLSSKQNYKGLISDFRIYATALSADDVKDLYELGAAIDTNNILYTYELNEE